jgi:hypothetical protein
MWRDGWKGENAQLRMSRPLDVDLDAAGSNAREWLLRALASRREWKLVSDSLALLLLRIGPPPSSKSFFLSGCIGRGLSDSGMFSSKVGVSAFAPFGTLVAVSGLARSHPAHVQGAAK